MHTDDLMILDYSHGPDGCRQRSLTSCFHFDISCLFSAQPDCFWRFGRADSGFSFSSSLPNVADAHSGDCRKACATMQRVTSWHLCERRVPLSQLDLSTYSGRNAYGCDPNHLSIALTASRSDLISELSVNRPGTTLGKPRELIMPLPGSSHSLLNC